MSKIAAAPTMDQQARKARLSLLAQAPDETLAVLWDEFLDGSEEPAHRVIRSPEIGTVMVRGRMGGTGTSFNLGEMTVTRCSVQLTSGAVGHGHVQGRSRDSARIAALVDALAEGGHSAEIDTQIIAPLRAAAQDRKTARAEKAAATKVEFFTMVRGEG